MELFERLAHIKKNGSSCVLVSAVEKQGEGPVVAGRKMIVEKDGTLYGTVGGGSLEYTAVEKAKTLFETQGTLLETYILQDGKLIEDATTVPMVCGGKVTLFFEYISGGDHVYIFGGGHVGRALCHVLNTMNFFTHVIEHREDVFAAIDFAQRKYLRSYEDFIKETDISPISYVLICTPSHKYDYDVVRTLLHKNIRPHYAGMLASKTKLRDFMQKMQDEFGGGLDLSFLYSPVGLDIGGSSPEEIAVSIAAEMLAVKYRKDKNTHLRDS